MGVRALRGLMLGALVLNVVTEIMSAAGQPWWSLSSHPNLGQGMLFATGVTATFCVVAFVGFVGMYTLKSWGRTLALVSTVAGLALWATGVHFAGQAGAASQVSLSSVLGHIAAMCWGGALSLAYFSPLAARFGANNSFKPTPLRGST